jgi:hypothetical protein
VVIMQKKKRYVQQADPAYFLFPPDDVISYLGGNAWAFDVEPTRVAGCTRKHVGPFGTK